MPSRDALHQRFKYLVPMIARAQICAPYKLTNTDFANTDAWSTTGNVALGNGQSSQPVVRVNLAREA